MTPRAAPSARRSACSARRSRAAARLETRGSCAVPVGDAGRAIIGVGADELPAAAIVGHDLVEEAVIGVADRAAFGPALDGERVVGEIEALDRRVRRQR